LSLPPLGLASQTQQSVADRVGRERNHRRAIPKCPGTARAWRVRLPRDEPAPPPPDELPPPPRDEPAPHPPHEPPPPPPPRPPPRPRPLLGLRTTPLLRLPTSRMLRLPTSPLLRLPIGPRRRRAREGVVDYAEQSADVGLEVAGAQFQGLAAGQRGEAGRQ